MISLSCISIKKSDWSRCRTVGLRSLCTKEKYTSNIKHSTKRLELPYRHMEPACTCTQAHEMRLAVRTAGHEEEAKKLHGFALLHQLQ